MSPRPAYSELVNKVCLVCTPWTMQDVVVLVVRTNISVGCYRKSLRAAGLTTIDPIATSTIRLT